jgi:hypothetical protein
MELLRRNSNGKADVIHACLGCPIVAIQQRLMDTASTSKDIYEYVGKEYICKDERIAELSLQPPAHGFFYSEDGGDRFHRNVGSHKIYTAPHPRRRHSS